MSKSITNAILESVSNKRLVEMPEGGDSPMGLLGQVLDTMTSLGWSYTETDYSGNEGGYEFENWSPAGEDLILDANYGSKDLSDDEKGKNLIEDIVSYCDNFDVDDHVEMWLEARDSVRGVPQSARTLVEDAEDIEEMYQEIVKELRKINHPMNESYVYNWKDDIEDIEATEANDDIWYAVAENMCEKEPDEYGSDPYEVMSNIINLFKVPKRSRLYKYLIKWFGSEEKLLSEVRDVYETNDAIYFVTGCGYAIFDADLLGGNADGETERKFDQFVREQEGLNESAKVKLTELDSFEYKGHKYIPVGNIKSNKALPRLISNSISDEYNKDYNYDDFYKVAPNYDIFKVDGTDTLVVPGSNHLFSFNGDSDSYIPINNIKSDEELRTIDSVGYIGNEYDKEIVDDILSDKSYSDIAYDIGWGLNVYQLYNLANLYINNKNVRSKIEELLTDINYHTECETLSENPEEFKNKIMTELNSSNLSESINLKYLKRLTEAPEDISEEEEEYELANNVPEDNVEGAATEEMSDTEYEEEAEDDAKDIVKDDIEEPWYATSPELDELRDVLPELDYRLLMMDDGSMVCVGRLNGPDDEILTSNRVELEKEAEISEANDEADEVEERAEEQEEESYEYIWIKRPESKEEFLNQVNVLYLSPEMSEEDKEQYAGLEVNHENLLSYLKGLLPEDKKEEVEEKEETVEEEPTEDIEIKIDEEPVEEVSEEDEKEEK